MLCEYDTTQVDVYHYNTSGATFSQKRDATLMRNGSMETMGLTNLWGYEKRCRCRRVHPKVALSLMSQIPSDTGSNTPKIYAIIVFDSWKIYRFHKGSAFKSPSCKERLDCVANSFYRGLPYRAYRKHTLVVSGVSWKLFGPFTSAII